MYAMRPMPRSVDPISDPLSVPVGVPDPALARAGGILTIDLAAIVANWRALVGHAPSAECAAVLKADAYGLDAARVAPALAAAGCRTFFVAHLDEGIALRRILPGGARIAVLHGPMPGTEGEFPAHTLLPVLNSTEQVRDYARLAGTMGRRLPAILQSDTGMARLGLSRGELDALVNGGGLSGLDLVLHMSHLACADSPGNPANPAQLHDFTAACARLPGVPASLSASSGIFLGPDYHFDLVRPGAALYGIAPQAGAPNPLKLAIRLQGRVVQLREVPAATAIGYGHTAHTTERTHLATIGIGYADGFLRSLSNRGAGWFRGVRLPIVGRVSMDSVILDASALPAGALHAGDLVDFIGPDQDLDAIARDAGTIGYEILTSLGARYPRRHLGL
ncbi:alanine racemase [Xanthobacter autotrophicus DSM 431]|uniref:alanine racemase n=1 Tax=Xanthobacter nonsaccharivorans TaxID=3119912 RepID=UPI00372A7877